MWSAIRLPGPLGWRLVPLGVFVLGTAAFFAVFRIAGFDGDLWPRLDWRFASDPHYRLALEPAAPRKDTPEPVDPAAQGDDDPHAEEPRFPGFLGADRSGRIATPPGSVDWATRPPRLVWKRPVGAGWSGFAAGGGRIYTMEQRGDVELTACYRLDDATPEWSHARDGGFASIIAGSGPRSTPTLAGRLVISVGAGGDVLCAEAATGRVLWERNVLTDTGTQAPYYGYSASAWVTEDRVILPGGSPDRDARGATHNLICYRLDTGQPLWTSQGDGGSYSSPVAWTMDGVEQLVVVNESSASGHAPDDGRRLWQVDWPGTNGGAANVSQPIRLDATTLFLSKGYGTGCAAFRIAWSGDTWSTEPLYAANTMKTKFTSAVQVTDTIYGLDEGILMAIDPATGRRLWKAGRYGHGQVLALHPEVGPPVLLIQAERGEVVLVACDPQQHTELARLPALEGTTWNTPAVVGRWLLVRNAQEAHCYELPVTP